MTREEYEAYETAVGEWLEGYDYGTTGSELWFSWRPCDCCDRPEGGVRYRAVRVIAGQHGKTDGQHEICADCVHYLTYGRLDDETMESIEAKESVADPVETDSWYGRG